MIWRALHVHTRVDQDLVAAGAVGRWLGVDGQDAPRTFFIRYWRGGPHLRLRYQVSADDDLAERRAVILADLADLVDLAARPATPLSDPAADLADQKVYAALEGVDAPSVTVPDGTVLDAPYEPEYAKYGGPRGVQIAEDLWVASTRSVLSGPVDDPAGRGLATLFTALRAADMSAAEMLSFLTYYSGHWSGYVSVAEWRQWEDRVDAVAQEAVDRAEDILAGTAVHGPLRTWETAIGEAVRAARAEEPVLRAGIGSMDPSARSSLDHHLLGHYLHTHFNRMGVLADEESFLGHLGQTLVRRLART